MLFTDFIELHGDRNFGDDKALIAGLAKFHGRPVVVIGHQKGRDTKQRVERNFGQPKPEGYRKALAKMKLATKYGICSHLLTILGIIAIIARKTAPGNVTRFNI